MAISERIESTGPVNKEFSEETLAEIKSLNLKEFAEAMGDQLRRSGKWYMTTKNGGENKPSVGINPEKRSWNDFTRDGVGGNDALSYYIYRTYDASTIKGPRFIDSVIQVCNIAGIPVKYTDGTVIQATEARRVSKNLELIDQATDAKADDAKLDHFYRGLLDMLYLRDGHMRHLAEERGLTTKEIDVRGYRTVTDNKRNRYVLTKDLINQLGAQPEGVPGFALMKGPYGDYWTFVGRNGFLIPFRNLVNQICGFQLRVDEPYFIRSTGNFKTVLNDGKVEILHKDTAELIWKGTREDIPRNTPMEIPGGKIILEETQKYLWVSTSRDLERGILQGARIGHPTPPPFHTAVPSDVLKVWQPGERLSNIMDTETVWWGEGPLKGDISADYTDQVHLQVAGVTSYEQLFEPTIQLGAKEVVIAFDADAQTKVHDVGETVLRCVQRAKEVLVPRGIKLKMALWNVNQAKGLDDILTAGFKPYILDLP